VQSGCAKTEKERKDQIVLDVQQKGAGRGEEKKPSTQGREEGTEEGEEREKRLVVYGVST
jgi:hypothetical protein